MALKLVFSKSALILSSLLTDVDPCGFCIFSLYTSFGFTDLFLQLYQFSYVFCNFLSFIFKDLQHGYHETNSTANHAAKVRTVYISRSTPSIKPTPFIVHRAPVKKTCTLVLCNI